MSIFSVSGFKAFVVTLFVSAGVSAQGSANISNVSARETTSLDGQWKSIVDPSLSAYKRKWLCQQLYRCRL